MPGNKRRTGGRSDAGVEPCNKFVFCSRCVLAKRGESGCVSCESGGMFLERPPRVAPSKEDEIKFFPPVSFLSPIELIVARAVCKIAQQACRQGEDGTRSWASLKSLEELDSWNCVGRFYARQIMEEIRAEYVDYDRLRKDISK